MNEEQHKIIIQETFNNVSREYDSKELRFFSESAKYLTSILRLRGNESVIELPPVQAMQRWLLLRISRKVM
jgi:hypothetical protein